MKRFSLLVSTLAVGAVLMCGNTAFAQGGTGTDGGTTGTTATDNRDNRDDSPDYGWLGLLGLAGLAGLLKKPERHVVHQNDTPRTNPPVR
ncbi:MAG TPA: WGxxGxxG family protein [Abditibacteriaceae bacterium]|jgi:MYXO-CTERM domain-containing protein